MAQSRGADNALLLDKQVSDPSFGDNVSMYTATSGQVNDIRKGTSSSPDTTAGALIKVSRTVNIPKPGSADLGEEMAAIMGICSGIATSEAQPVGVYGAAKSNYSGSGVGSSKGDACGVYGFARFTGSGSGLAIGGFFSGRTDTTGGYATALELGTQNFSGLAGSYNSTGYTRTAGAWITALGDADSGVGIVIGNGFGYQYKVGLAFNGQVNGGKTGGIADSSIRDDSTSSVALDIRGTHASGAIVIAADAGTISHGGAAVVGINVNLRGKITGAVSSYACASYGTIQSDVTSLVEMYNSNPGTQAAAFTLSNLRHFSVNQATFGAGSTVTKQVGFIVTSSMTGAGTNYAFEGLLAAGSGRRNLSMSGTAENYLGGVTGIGTGPAATSWLTLAASTTGVSSLNVPHGTAPSSPVNGDIWTTTAGLYVRVNGSTVGPLS